MKCPTLCSSTLSECIQTNVSGVFQAWLAPGLTINLLRASFCAHTAFICTGYTIQVCWEVLKHWECVLMVQVYSRCYFLPHLFFWFMIMTCNCARAHTPPTHTNSITSNCFSPKISEHIIKTWLKNKSKYVCRKVYFAKFVSNADLSDLTLSLHSNLFTCKAGVTKIHCIYTICPSQ